MARNVIESDFRTYEMATLTDTHPQSISVSRADRYAPPRDIYVGGMDLSLHRQPFCKKIPNKNKNSVLI